MQKSFQALLLQYVLPTNMHVINTHVEFRWCTHTEARKDFRIFTKSFCDIEVMEDQIKGQAEGQWTYATFLSVLYSVCVWWRCSLKWPGCTPWMAECWALARPCKDHLWRTKNLGNWPTLVEAELLSHGCLHAWSFRCVQPLCPPPKQTQCIPKVPPWENDWRTEAHQWSILYCPWQAHSNGEPQVQDYDYICVQWSHSRAATPGTVCWTGLLMNKQTTGYRLYKPGVWLAKPGIWSDWGTMGLVE